MKPKRMVKVEIPKDADVNNTMGSVGLDDIVVTGRLLGAVTIAEARKIIQNTAVAQRLSTGPTVTLEDALSGLEYIEKNKEGKGRMVIAVKSYERDLSLEEVDAITRQLYITPEIDLVSQVGEDKDGLKDAILQCDNDDLITISEEEA